MKQRYPELPPVILQMLHNRGISEEKDIEKFMRADFTEDTYDPFLFSQMKEAVRLIIEHIKAGHRIGISADYDADGVTSGALLYELFRTLRADADVYIPDRVKDGYGMNAEGIDIFISGGVRLVISVDCGMKNKEVADYARTMGLDVIITDHHLPPDEIKDLPDCPIINPNNHNEEYPFKKLAGVGVAFKLAQALVESSKLPPDLKQRVIERSLDLVAIGTVADCVALVDENRALVRKGLEVLNNTKRPGLLKLVEASGINKGSPLQSWNIGFQIAPRLNAAGRMDHANTALELLTTDNEEEAAVLAERLNRKNSQRQDESAELYEEVSELIDKDDEIFVLVQPEERPGNWNEGIIGLVAGRIMEDYYRPTIILARSETGYKGSGRSIPEINIVKIMEANKGYIEKYGGHPSACGLSVARENIDKLKQGIKEAALQAARGLDLVPSLFAEMELPLRDISHKLFEEISAFEPFGNSNDRPNFVSRGVEVVDITKMGLEGQHLKLKLNDGSSAFINALGFSQSETWQDLRIGDKIDIVYYLDLNEFNGRSEIQMKIIDIKKFGHL